MHASIGHYHGLGAATDEVIQAARHLVAALSHAPGFVSYALLDVGDGALASISIFESRSELDDGDRLIGAWMAEHLPRPPGTPASTEIGEIVLQRGM
jgi:hypothetical protein